MCTHAPHPKTCTWEILGTPPCSLSKGVHHLRHHSGILLYTCTVCSIENSHKNRAGKPPGTLPVPFPCMCGQSTQPCSPCHSPGVSKVHSVECTVHSCILESINKCFRLIFATNIRHSPLYGGTELVFNQSSKLLECSSGCRFPANTHYPNI